MPPKKISSNNIYICIDEEHYVPLTGISDVPVSEEDMEDLEYEKVDLDGEITFEIEPPRSFRELSQFIELIHPSLSWLSWWIRRYGNNNWRKLHGLPMTRRKNGYTKRRT